MKFLIFLFLFLSAGHARQAVFPTPSSEVIELANASRFRTLTASEVERVSKNPLAGVVYFSNALKSPNNYLLPLTPPRGCLIGPLYKLLAGLQRGELTDDSLESLASEFPKSAYIAYMIGFDGLEHPTLVRLLASQSSKKLRAMQLHPVVRHLKARKTEPSLTAAKVDYYLKHFPMNPDLAAARLVEVGPPAADILVERLRSAEIPGLHDSDALRRHFQLLNVTILVLGGLHDSRLQPGQAISSANEAILGKRSTQRLKRFRNLGRPSVRPTHAAAYWRLTCDY